MSNYHHEVIIDCQNWAMDNRNNLYACCLIEILRCLQTLHELEMIEKRHIDMTAQFKARDDIIAKVLEHRKLANDINADKPYPSFPFKPWV